MIFGKLNKKSQVIGKWEERFIVINKEGLFSYKKFNEKHSWSIASGTIKEIWTRFEIQDNLLIVKVHHGSKKTEFGFPLADFVNCSNWLFHFYCMMGKKWWIDGNILSNTLIFIPLLPLIRLIIRMSSNLKVHNFKAVVTIHQINISVKFPCSVSTGVRAGTFSLMQTPRRPK